MDTTDTLDFAAWLRGRRAEKAQKQTELAAVLGCSQQTIGQWEKGAAAPVKLVDVAALAEWGGVTVAELSDRILRGAATAA